ncbi:MAG: hypothetical protein MRY23_01965 [Pelagibacteraceae bacterium]|nr:hypothetical protein [Pelagibacteraceae bacterium]MCI5079646.1 hypothetical protein [Pelagibacteraceae bacterium]
MNQFLCPECGSKDGGLETLLNKEMNEESKDPWDSVLEQIECSVCGSVIPAHLAERWDNLSIEDAKKEWKEKYKKNNQKQKF